jgi:phosphatidylglycerophosphatase A
LVILAAVCFCGAAAELIGRKDPSEVILDEFACMPLALAGLQHVEWSWILVYFLLFRLLDITKPFGIRRLEKLPVGIGIVADDLAAALLTNGILHVVRLFV